LNCLTVSILLGVALENRTLFFCEAEIVPLLLLPQVMTGAKEYDRAFKGKY
jgi:hypothetical protein